MFPLQQQPSRAPSASYLKLKEAHQEAYAQPLARNRFPLKVEAQKERLAATETEFTEMDDKKAEATAAAKARALKIAQRLARKRCPPKVEARKSRLVAAEAEIEEMNDTKAEAIEAEAEAMAAARARALTMTAEAAEIAAAEKEAMKRAARRKASRQERERQRVINLTRQPDDVPKKKKKKRKSPSWFSATAQCPEIRSVLKNPKPCKESLEYFSDYLNLPEIQVSSISYTAQTPV